MTVISQETRLRSIDGLRNIMCVGIALYHFIPYFFSGNDPEYLASRYFSYFTDVFAVLAGLFSARYLKDVWTITYLKSFLVKRLSRIYPLHLATLAFYISVSALLVLNVVKVEDRSRYDFSAVLPHLTLTHSWGFGPAMAMNYPSWMISAIATSYLVLPFAAMAFRRSRLLLVTFAIFTMAICLIIADYNDIDITRSQFIGIGIVRVLPSFVVGLVIGKIDKTKTPKTVIIASMITAFVLLFGFDTPLHGFIRLVLIYVFIAAIVMADSNNINSPLSAKALTRISTYSFGVYLWHGVIATVLFRVLVPKLLNQDTISIGNNSSILAYSMLIGGIGISFTAAAISLKTIEIWGSNLFNKAFN
ncbi:acyltransferase family protein [Sphingomonas sp. T1]|uniref:acyltransferase family protein n=1 Tax=Sphingomonas sp. T1 TaxID=2653172 RepID=UPI001357B3CE|nr:acyltransferase [Sphingomonas sp. T1]